MTKISLHTILLTLIALGIVIFSLWFLTHFERVREEEYTGYQGKAQSNPLLAAERLLNKMGVSAKTVTSFIDITEQHLQPRTTLFLLKTTTLYLTEIQVEYLFTWVKSGGHLIYESEMVYDKDNASQIPSILGSLNVRRQKEYRQDYITEDKINKFEWLGQQLEVIFKPHYYFDYDDEPAFLIENDRGVHMLHYEMGKGGITLLSDTNFLENDEINNYDHAQFLWHLVNLFRPTTQVWLLQVKDIPSLLALLWQYQKLLVISLGILFFILLWTMSGRFGPLLPLPTQKRRRLLEHIEASGQFLWRYKQVDKLLSMARQNMLARLAVIHPHWVEYTTLQLVEQLAQQTKLSPDTIEFSLYSAKVNTNTVFIQAIQTLIKIKSSL